MAHRLAEAKSAFQDQPHDLMILPFLPSGGPSEKKASLWRRWGLSGLLPAVALACVFSQSAEAGIANCDAFTRWSHTIPGLRPSANSNPGDVIMTGRFDVTVRAVPRAPHNNNEIRLGAAYLKVGPQTGLHPTFHTLPTAMKGVGVRLRHSGGVVKALFESGSPAHESIWSGERITVAPASDGLTQFFSWSVDVEVVLTDPKIYTGEEKSYFDAVTNPLTGVIVLWGPRGNSSFDRGCHYSRDIVPYPDLPLFGGVVRAPTAQEIPPPPITATCVVSLSSQLQTFDMSNVRFPPVDGVSVDSVPITLEMERCVPGAEPRVNFTDGLSPANTSTDLSLRSASNVSTLGGIRLRDGNGRDVVLGPQRMEILSNSVVVPRGPIDETRRLNLTAHMVRRGAGEVEPGTFDAAATFVLVYP